MASGNAGWSLDELPVAIFLPGGRRLLLEIISDPVIILPAAIRDLRAVADPLMAATEAPAVPAPSGGVLLKSPTVTVNSGATIDALGGGSSTTNGGTVKIFTDSHTNSGTISRGRLCQGTYSGSCATQ